MSYKAEDTGMNGWNVNILDDVAAEFSYDWRYR